MIQQSTNRFWLKHSQTQATRLLTLQEATIAHALLQGIASPQI
jgi:hypothetical protein